MIALLASVALAEEPAEEIVVHGRSEGERRRRSAEAVHVVELDEARRGASDLGEILARQQGVRIQRTGGLGSSARVSLGGLTDEQVRFFVDGVPLELAGFPFGVASVPVDLLSRVEVYRGVVPVRFGADALGGAVDLVADAPVDGSGGSLSYEAGSFDTHRAAATGRFRGRGGLFARGHAFFDDAANDYAIDVEATNAAGQLVPVEVRRFHDAYRAGGGSLELGVAERAFADRLSVRAFVTSYDQEHPHNLVMTVPYADARYGGRTAGAIATFESPAGHDATLSATLGWSRERTTFTDTGTCIADWFGQCVGERAQPGEIEPGGFDVRTEEDRAFARLLGALALGARHAVRLSVAPTASTRTGDDRLLRDDGSDPHVGPRSLAALVTGLEHAAGDRLENVAFVKDYAQIVRAVEPLPGGVERDLARRTHRVGLGDALRWRFSDAFWAKASYEWATRLPGADEVFGDGALTVSNLDLRPERSHNANLGATLDAPTASGRWQADANLFLRDADDLIVLLADDRAFHYDNVFSARARGIEGAVGWTAPRDRLDLSANLTWVDFRNTSTEGEFAAFAGDRIPNRPWLFANGAAAVRLPEVAAAGDALTVGWDVRWVASYLRGWESLGRLESKQVIPAQTVHAASVTYTGRADLREVSCALEVHNVTDAAVFDVYGVQRPGRAVFGKVRVSL